MEFTYCWDTLDISGCAACRAGGFTVSLTCSLPGRHCLDLGSEPTVTWTCCCPVPCGRKTECTGRENAATSFPAGQRGAQDCKRHHHNHSVTGLCEGVLNTWTPASSCQGECLVQSITAIGETFPRAASELFNLQKSVQTRLVSDKC